MYLVFIILYYYFPEIRLFTLVIPPKFIHYYNIEFLTTRLVTVKIIITVRFFIEVIIIINVFIEQITLDFPLFNFHYHLII